MEIRFGHTFRHQMPALDVQKAGFPVDDITDQQAAAAEHGKNRRFRRWQPQRRPSVPAARHQSSDRPAAQVLLIHAFVSASACRLMRQGVWERGGVT